MDNPVLSRLLSRRSAVLPVLLSVTAATALPEKLVRLCNLQRLHALLTNSRHIFPFLGHENLLRNFGSTRISGELAFVEAGGAGAERRPDGPIKRQGILLLPRWLVRRQPTFGDVSVARARCEAGSFSTLMVSRE